MLLGLEDDGSISGLTRANIEEWVMTTCRDQAPRGGARRGLCEGRRRGRIGRPNGHQRLTARKMRGPSHDDVLAHAWLTRCASAFRVIRVSGAQAGTVRSIRQ